MEKWGLAEMEKYDIHHTFCTHYYGRLALCTLKKYNLLYFCLAVSNILPYFCGKSLL